MSGFRIVVDRDLCQGHAVCEAEAASVFEVPKTGQVVVLDESPGEAERAAVELAVKYCPTHALKIVDDEE
jgi:sterol 14-demethylase